MDGDVEHSKAFLGYQSDHGSYFVIRLFGQLVSESDHERAPLAEERRKTHRSGVFMYELEDNMCQTALVYAQQRHDGMAEVLQQFGDMVELRMICDDLCSPNYSISAEKFASAWRHWDRNAKFQAMSENSEMLTEFVFAAASRGNLELVQLCIRCGP